MASSQDNSTGWIFLTWLAVFLVSCLIAATAWKTLGSLDIDVFPVNNTIESLAAQIATIQAHYTQTANSQKELVEIWGLAALVLGVSGGVASVLRAPQAVIVGLGGFAAIIYGATQIYDPQLAVQTLNAARTQLACVSPRVQTLAQLRQRTEPFVLNARDSASRALTPLAGQSATYSAEFSRLATVRVAQADERALALEAIDSALLSPSTDTFELQERISNSWQDLSHLVESIKSTYHETADASLLDPLNRLHNTQQQLDSATNTLRRPAELESRLASASEAYHGAMTHSAALLAAGETLTAQARDVSLSLTASVSQLERWPADFESALTTAYGAINQIQNTVSSRIAAGGVINTPIGDIVAQAIDRHLGEPPPQPHFSESQGAADYALMNAPSAAPRELLDAALLIAQANQAIQQAELLLAEHADALAQATEQADTLSTLVLDTLPVISVTTQRLSQASFSLDNTGLILSEQIAAGTRATEEAHAILNQPAPAAISAGIDTCLNTVTDT